MGQCTVMQSLKHRVKCCFINLTWLLDEASAIAAAGGPTLGCLGSLAAPAMLLVLRFDTIL